MLICPCKCKSIDVKNVKLDWIRTAVSRARRRMTFLKALPISCMKLQFAYLVNVS